jgi:hypothetical protein
MLGFFQLRTLATEAVTLNSTLDALKPSKIWHGTLEATLL